MNKARPAELTVATGPDALLRSHGFRSDQERRLLAIRRKRRSEAGEAEQSRNEAERSGAKRSEEERSGSRDTLIQRDRFFGVNAGNEFDVPARSHISLHFSQ